MGHILPELDAAIDGVTIGSEGDVAGKILHKLGVAAAEKNGVADQRCPETFNDVENGFSPALNAATFQAYEADVVFVGAAFSVGQMGKFKGDDHAVEDHGRAETCANAEKEHATTLIAAEGLHGGIVDEAERLAEGLLVGRVDPSGGE